MRAPLLTSAELLIELNIDLPAGEKRISKSTLHLWATTRPKWRACIVERTARKVWFSRQKLIDVGILMRAIEPTQTIPGPGFSYSFTSEAM